MIEKDLGERPGTPVPPSSRHRMAILLALVAAGVISVVAGLLSHAAGNNIPDAILTGGAAFAGAVGLSLTIAHYVGVK
ncbi:hypothetical protein QLQ12_29610 [Actinoplanes sp. NEAU-A12]|uniref:Uncharacterized protein n=1 Tax=Actinoplanes sandaracinus TaxID=3045177 RepID=A0ABT6WT37_9ACTN|nr:hypothetical protein [Actinoplanes sandaracinus]MDI6102785.1 hypothetical protein [Actinoplanes sandaracinus]